MIARNWTIVYEASVSWRTLIIQLDEIAYFLNEQIGFVFHEKMAEILKNHQFLVHCYYIPISINANRHPHAVRGLPENSRGD